MRISDWSSDVCSSDLLAGIRQGEALTIRFVGVSYIVITSPHMGDREMSPLRLDHVTLSSGRMDDTVAFYGEILRMRPGRSEEHTSELQSLMRISYAVFCLKKKIQKRDKQYDYVLS